MKTRAIPDIEFVVQEAAAIAQSTGWPLSSNQLRIWFVEQLAEQTAVNNLYFGVRLTGHLDLAALDQSLSVLVDRHETLRTTFDLRNGEPVQFIQGARPPIRALIDSVGTARWIWRKRSTPSRAARPTRRSTWERDL